MIGNEHKLAKQHANENIVQLRLRTHTAQPVISNTTTEINTTIAASTLADPGIYFGGPNQDPQSKVEGEARIEGAKRPSIEGEARVEGAKRPRIEGEA